MRFSVKCALKARCKPIAHQHREHGQSPRVMACKGSIDVVCLLGCLFVCLNDLTVNGTQ